MRYKQRELAIKKASFERKHAAPTKKKFLLLKLVQIKDKYGGGASWHYVLLHEPLRWKEIIRVKDCAVELGDYGRIVKSGRGKEPPSDVRREIEDEFGWE